MIRRLRNRFILIAMLSVTAVMGLLTLILNGANMLCADGDLQKTLTLIYENEGSIPVAPGKNGETGEAGEPLAAPPDGEKGGRGPFTQETPYSTRYFVLRYQDDGTLVRADLDNIASVTADDAQEYVAVAQKNGAGYGRYGDYRFLVGSVGNDKNMAVFLDSYQTFRSMHLVLLWSLLADAACVLLVLLLVILLSRRAIDPLVRSAQQQKQFITDASHELKTPITVIATSLKVLEMDVGKQKWIDKALLQTDKLTGLVNSLVTLSRMDEEESPLKMEEFCISEAVAETAESFEEFSASKGHKLLCSVAPGLSYCGDEYAIRQLASVLLDNAVKYAAEGSDITLSLEKGRRGVLLRSSNRCDAPENIDTNKLFDRFYRADPSRSASGAGYGIGLSIARSIAEGHHGSIRAALHGDEIELTAELR